MALHGKLACEAIGTMFLLLGTTGSGIAGFELSGGNEAMTLLAVSISAGAMLFAWINVFARQSGAHFNPAVTLGVCVAGRLNWRVGLGYMAVQVLGGSAGICIAHLMFGQPVIQSGTAELTGIADWTSEAVATFGLVLIIMRLADRSPQIVAAAVSVYIAGSHWCTGTGAFANPAVSIARGLTDTFTGIARADIPAFIAVQVAAALLAVAVHRGLMQGGDE